MRHRVFTYITKGESLLIFDHVDFPNLEPQIPGGTIDPNEDPGDAALREATEETGLHNLELVKFLGSFEKDLSEFGRNETIFAHFYHLHSNQDTRLRWRHFEVDSSETDDPIEFELYWVPINQLPKLGGIDGAMLKELQQSVTSNAA